MFKRCWANLPPIFLSIAFSFFLSDITLAAQSHAHEFGHSLACRLGLFLTNNYGVPVTTAYKPTFVGLSVPQQTTCPISIPFLTDLGGTLFTFFILLLVWYFAIPFLETRFMPRKSFWKVQLSPLRLMAIIIAFQEISLNLICGDTDNPLFNIAPLCQQYYVISALALLVFFGLWICWCYILFDICNSWIRDRKCLTPL